jgi:hypothetical protein
MSQLPVCFAFTPGPISDAGANNTQRTGIAKDLAARVVFTFLQVYLSQTGVAAWPGTSTVSRVGHIDVTSTAGRQTGSSGLYANSPLHPPVDGRGLRNSGRRCPAQRHPTTRFGNCPGRYRRARPRFAVGVGAAPVVAGGGAPWECRGVVRYRSSSAREKRSFRVPGHGVRRPR